MRSTALHLHDGRVTYLLSAPTLPRALETREAAIAQPGALLRSGRDVLACKRRHDAGEGWELTTTAIGWVRS
jgi:hypothetical protein